MGTAGEAQARIERAGSCARTATLPFSLSTLVDKQRDISSPAPPRLASLGGEKINLSRPKLILIRSRQVLYVHRMTSDFETQLRAVSLRVTRPRLAVLAALRDHPHVDTDTVIALVRADHPTVSHQAVYDVLRALADAGLVRRIQPAGAIARYESRVGDNHHHVVCRSCGAIADIDCAVGYSPCLTASDDHGFTVDEAEIVYWGTCPDCTTKRTSQ
jgi:Fe2+ or Zn2+ uptake regulation protein